MGGYGETADEVGVDAFAVFGPALGGAEQVAELDRGLPAVRFARFRVQRRRGLDRRFSDPRQVATALVGGDSRSAFS